MNETNKLTTASVVYDFTEACDGVKHRVGENLSYDATLEKVAQVANLHYLCVVKR